MSVLAFDFGASTGRALLGELVGDVLRYTEINRFDNRPYKKDGHMFWDFESLWANIKESIKRAGDIDSIGIDTWGVDYGVINSAGELVHDPYHYRDDRTEQSFEAVTAAIPDLYERTGIEVMRINTMFQLVSERDAGGLKAGDKILLMPDLFAYMLTGVMASEYTIATTTGLVDQDKHDWNYSLIDELKLPRDIFTPIINNGVEYGYVKDELMAELGLSKKIKVIAVCTHDTASAISAMVTDPKSSIYISCGTWSLMGVEHDSVDVTNPLFTNEGGYNGSITYLSNIMGLWLMQEFRRKLEQEMGKVSFSDLEDMMDGAEVGKYIVDTNDEMFVAPDDMEEAIRLYIKKSGQGDRLTRGEIVRCIYDSLAAAYKARADMLSKASGNKYTTVNILGGGAQAKPLALRTHELTGLKVATGPIEATAIGNILVQLLALGEISSLEEARKIVARSENVRVYE